ncbi:MAG: helix-turn-helix transcriptional regulator [Bacteroidales bacterium]|nr:helix-turn-helix transcriptional regulator [Bacteroidales bacterium]
MRRQLNTSELDTYDEIKDVVALRGDVVILRDAARLKSLVVSSLMGDLLYVPVGRVALFTAGTARLRINLQPCDVAAGSVVVIPENCFMEVLAVDEAYNAQIVSFSGIEQPFRRWELLKLGGGDFERMLAYVDLLWVVAHSDTCEKATLDGLLTALLADLHSLNAAAEQAQTDSSPTAAKVLTQRFFDLLAESDGRRRSIGDCADRLCVSPNHLSAMVKQETGQTVAQLLNAHTVLQAKVLLLHSGLAVGEISERLGFENPPSFTRFFKREAGVTPREFQQPS